MAIKAALKLNADVGLAVGECLIGGAAVKAICGATWIKPVTSFKENTSPAERHGDDAGTGELASVVFGRNSTMMNIASVVAASLWT